VSGGAGSPAVQFYSDTMTINAPISFPGGLVLIAPNTPTVGIDLASAAPPPGTLELSDAALDRITAQTLQLGFLTGFSGPITVSGVVSPASVPNLALVTSGAITETPAGAVAESELALWAGGSISFPGPNTVSVLAGRAGATGLATSTFLFRNVEPLTVGVVDGLLADGGPGSVDPSMLGVATSGGNIIVETIGLAADLTLAETVNANGFDLASLVAKTVLGAAPGLIGLSSGGTITQAPAGLVVGAGLALSSARDAGLGEANRLGVNDVGGVPAGSGSLAGDLVSSVLVRADHAATGAGSGLTIGTVDVVDSFGARMFDQRTGTALTAGLSGMVTAGGAGANIIVETTGTGNLVLNAPVNANGGTTVLGPTPGLIGLSSAATITQAPAGIIVGAGLELSAVGGVGLGEANRLGSNDVGGVPTGSGTLAGDLQSSVLFWAERAATAAGAGLTVSTVDVLDSFGSRMIDQRTGTPLTAGLSGVVATGGNILLETTTAGNLVLTPPVNAGTGSVALASAGTLTQDPAPIVASSLAIVSADRVSLGAFGGPSDLNQVGTLAGRVTNAGESFVFRNDALTLMIGTVDVSDSFGGRLAALPGPLSGVVTNNANIGLRVTSSGDLLLTQNVNAGAAGVGLESAGQVRQTGGTVTGGTLEVSAVGAVSLPDTNAVPVLAAQVTGAGNSLLFRDDGLSLSVDTVPTLLESGTGTPPNNQMLSVGGLSGITTAAGDIALHTTTSGDLTLRQNLNANGGSVALISAGNALEAGNGAVTASGLIVDAAANVAFGITETGGTALLGNPNNVGTLTGTAGGVFGFLNGPALTVGAVPSVVDVAAQSGISASATTAGDVLIQTNNAGQPLTLAANVTGGGRAIFDTAGGFVQTGVVSVTDPVLAVDTTGSGMATMLAIVNSTAVNASAIAGLPPSGKTSNPMQFADLVAGNSTVLLFADRATVGGFIEAGQLGLSGTGNFANLRGSIAGLAGPTAARIGVRDPGPEITYLFNDCIIAAAFCVPLPSGPFVVQPQPVAELTALIPLPDLAATPDFVTPDVIRAREQPNPDAPVINIFDEERL